MLAILQSGTGRDLFHDSVKASVEQWIAAIAVVVVEAGIDPMVARQRAEDALIAIQGSLVVSQALDDPALFQRVMQALPQQLLAQSSI